MYAFLMALSPPALSQSNASKDLQIIISSLFIGFN
jgi:hypothetical protein